MKVEKIYRRTSIMVLVLTIVHLLIFNLNIEGLWGVFVVNFGYHMPYQFSKLIGTRQFLAFMMIFASFALAGTSIFATVNTGDYNLLLLTCLAAGLFLGGIRVFEQVQDEL